MEWIVSDGWPQAEIFLSDVFLNIFDYGKRWCLFWDRKGSDNDAKGLQDVLRSVTHSSPNKGYAIGQQDGE